MSPTMTLKGQMKFSLKKALVGGDLTKSTYTGPGELLLAPASIGDITIIKLGGHEQWSVGKDAFLACTQGIVTEYKSQGLGKAMFSGEGLFVYKISGQGILWCTSFGAIIRKDVSCPCPLWTLNIEKKVDADAFGSCRKTKSTSSTMVILLRGTANTCLSAWRRAGFCRICMPAKGWCVSLRGRGLCLCRRGMRRLLGSGWRRTRDRPCRCVDGRAFLSVEFVVLRVNIPFLRHIILRTDNDILREYIGS
jgi:hypothetical protein